MTTFRIDEEVMRIMCKCVDFVSELIDYIAEYHDDDYMTMECLCRKLVKHGLIDKEDGYYLVDKGIKVAEQTEPKPCEECKHWRENHPCKMFIEYSDCRYEPKTEPSQTHDLRTDTHGVCLEQTEPICENCKWAEVEWADEPCENCCKNNSGFEPKQTKPNCEECEHYGHKVERCLLNKCKYTADTDCGWK